ncbi:unnamed protein product, partial [Amaranthus hypochondriacus]
MGRVRNTRARESSETALEYDSWVRGKSKRQYSSPTSTKFKLHHHLSPFHRPKYHHLSPLHRPQYQHQPLPHVRERQVDKDGFIIVRKKKRVQLSNHPHQNLRHSERFWNRNRVLIDDPKQNRGKGRRHYTTNNGGLTCTTPDSGSTVGHRGLSRHPWWRGPREPPQPGLAHTSFSAVSLFVDGISRSTTLTDIRELFEKEGMVSDVYISGKHRKNKKFSFGFVRYVRGEEAENAIKQFQGYCLKGSVLRVSLAKFQKGGKPIVKGVETGQKGNVKKKEILSPAHRDNRSYSDVLMGKRLPVEIPEQQVLKNNKTQTSVNVSVNQIMESKLKLAAVVEFVKAMDPKKAESIVAGTNIPYAYMSSISPTKLLLFFDEEINLKNVLNESSPFRQLFKDVRSWSVNECVDDRFTWIVCTGVNPLCWSLDNFEKIGELWGTTLHVDNDFYGVNSLTVAKILI